MNLASLLLGTSLCALASCVNPASPSNNLLELASLLATKFNNIEQVLDDESKGRKSEHEEVTIEFKPVVVSILKPNITFDFQRGTANGEYVGPILITLGEDEKQEKILAKKIFLVKPFPESEYPGLTQEDMIPSDDCTGLFQRTGPTMYSGTWPACTRSDVKASFSYAITLNCDGMTVTIDTTNLPGYPTLSPYVFNVQQKYPLDPSYLESCPNFTPTCPS